jgi:hypothetical protein
VTRRNPLLTIVLAIVVLLVVDVLLTRFWPRVPLRGWLPDLIVIGVVGYVIGAILIRNGARFPALKFPSLPRRRRMRVVKRDPTQAASDFIKQFEERSKR